MRDPVVLQDRRTQVSGEGDVAIDLREGADVAAPPGVTNRSLRLLARWLVAAAQKAVPTGTERDPADPQTPVDVAADPKVGLDGK